MMPSGVTMISGGLFVGPDGTRYQRLLNEHDGPAYIPLCEGTRNDGDDCTKTKVAGRDFCVIHGGHRPVGAENPNFVNGRYSAFIKLPALAARVEHMASDPKWTSLHDNITLVDSRIAQLLERIDGQSATPFWERARQLCQRYADAQASGSPEALMLFRQLQDTLGGGADEEATWDEISVQHELRRKLSESDAKNMEKLAGTVSVVELAVFTRNFGDMVRDLVPAEKHTELAQRLRMLMVGAMSTRKQ